MIVGDTHQQIYGWRHAVNSLEKANFKTFNLSASFRFNQDIADLAMGVLDYKIHFDNPETISISGNGTNNESKSKAIIARTNLGLLLKAIEYVTEKRTSMKFILKETSILILMQMKALLCMTFSIYKIKIGK